MCVVLPELAVILTYIATKSNQDRFIQVPITSLSYHPNYLPLSQAKAVIIRRVEVASRLDLGHDLALLLRRFSVLGNGQVDNVVEELALLNRVAHVQGVWNRMHF